MFVTYQVAKSLAHIDLRFYEITLLPGWRLSHGYLRHGSGVFLHRLITSAKDHEMVDHKDGNPLNNELSNLRICSHGENMCNRKMHKNNKSGLKGIYQYRGKWVAQIKAGGTKHYLGSHNTKEEAHAAYSEASKRFHGDFSRSQ